MQLIVKWIAGSSVLAAVAMAQPPAPRYTIQDLGTLGGTYTLAYDLNNQGLVVGGSATKDQIQNGLNQHAFLWTKETGIHDLGTLEGNVPGLNSEGSGSNGRGEVAIISEVSNPAYMNEDFCAFGTHRQCLAAIWRSGVMKPLPNQVGGHNAAAFGINNVGQVIGFAENGTPDSTCLTPSQVLRFNGVIWGPNGEIGKLPPLPVDEVSFAFSINDVGQAVGVSGKCSDTNLPPGNAGGPPGGPHAVLWEKDGTPRDLGNLGGGTNNPSAINNNGDVAGTVQLPEGFPRAFVWTKDKGMQPLGTLPGDPVTIVPCCNLINNRGQIVGFSCGAAGCRAVIWQDKIPTDLNDLIPKPSQIYLINVAAINDAGQIVAGGLINGELHSFLLTPR